MAPAVHELDLTTIFGLESTADWIRGRVLLVSPAVAMLELVVLLPAEGGPPGRVSIFMDPGNAYVVGFRGRDRTVYLLDENSAVTAQRLRTAGLLPANENPVTLHGLGTSHRELGTFGPRHGAGHHGRTFHLTDLGRAARLSEFSSQSTAVTLAQVRDALSILVCMTSECARSFMVERSFERLYWLERVQADDAMQSYDQAVRITRYAEVFPNLVLADRIEKLDRRAREVEELSQSFEAAGQNRRALILAGWAPPARGERPEVQRLREMVRELHLTTVDQLTEVVSLCRNRDAVRAAMGGVLVPPIT